MDKDIFSNEYIDYMNYSLVIPVDLQLFAKDGPNGEKTEEPTSKKIEDTRKEGQVAKSQEINIAVLLLAFFVFLKFYIGSIGNQLLEVFPEAYAKFDDFVNTNTTVHAGHQLVYEFTISMAKILWPIMLVGVVVSFLQNRAQFTWKITFKPMEPKLSKISPLSGIKRMFSVRTLIQFAMSVAKVIIISYVVYSTLKDQWELLFNLYDMTVPQAIALLGDIVINLGIKISIYMCVVALLDFAYQKWKNHQDMMMSKQDIKDEFKNSEGDPQIKGRIKQKQREMSQQRMMQSVPQADVIITNPTHYAVAIEYKRDFQSAPVVVAKGTDYLANKIKEIAKENGVTMVENRALARMLYNNVEIGEEIPPELYQAVAEVLAYVYRLRESA